MVLVAILACTQGPIAPSITINHVNVHTNVDTVPVDTTTTRPPEPDPCDAPTSGKICTYVGIPHVAQFSAEDLDRRR